MLIAYSTSKLHDSPIGGTDVTGRSTRSSAGHSWLPWYTVLFMRMKAIDIHRPMWLRNFPIGPSETDVRLGDGGGPPLKI